MLDKSERLVLWASIKSPHDLAPSVIPKVEVEFFRSLAAKKLYSFVKKYYEDYNKVPSLEVLENEFQDNDEVRPIITMLKGLDFHEEDHEWLRDELDQSIRMMALTRAVLETAEAIRTKKVDRSQVEERFKRALSLTIKEDNIFRYSDPDIRRNLLQSSGGRFPTYYPTLDEITDGGLDDPCLFVIQSRSHGGKTAFKLNLAARAALHGKKCVFFSLEMSERQIYQRLDAIVLSENIRDIYKPKNIEDTIRRVRESLSNNGGDIIIIKRSPRSVSIQDIRGVLLDLHRRGEEFEYIFIDYINLIKEKGDLYERGVVIAEGLLELSFEFRCPVITSVQMQRNAYRQDLRKIDLDNVSESMGIANTSSFFLHLSRDMGTLVSSEVKFKILKDRIGGRPGYQDSFFFNQYSLKMYDPLEENLFLEEMKRFSSGGGGGPERSESSAEGVSILENL